MYRIVNNLLSEEEENILERSVLNGRTQWIFNRYAAYIDNAYNVNDETKKHISSFRHSVYQNNTMFDEKKAYEEFSAWYEKCLENGIEPEQIVIQMGGMRLITNEEIIEFLIENEKISE